MATIAVPVPTSLRDTAALIALVAQLVVTAWLVPDWTPTFEPAYLAAVCSVATSLVLLGLRARGIRGSRFELRVLALFLAGMPLIYVGSVLLHPQPGWLPVELVAVPVYAALAWRGLRSPYVLAAGIAAHGLVWDLWHHHRTDFMPSWYPLACLLVDIGLGLYLALEAPRFTPASVRRARAG